MSINPNNHSITIGRLTKDPVFFQNGDGSQSVRFTVAADHDYTDRDGKRGSDFVEFDGFIRKDATGPGVYGLMYEGSLVNVAGTPRINRYVPKGQTEAKYELVIRTESVQLLESKAVTDERRARKAAAASAPAAAAAATAPVAQAPVVDGPIDPLG